jgi:hypothetical protein
MIVSFGALGAPFNVQWFKVGFRILTTKGTKVSEEYLSELRALRVLHRK